MNKKAFVTGASGFVGGALVERLLADGWDVVALVRTGSDTGKLQSLGVRLVVGDVCQPDGLVEAIQGADVVFHCAALTGVGHSINDFHQVITQGTKTLLNAAQIAGAKRFVFVSSVAVYELEGVSSCDEQQPLLTSSIDPYANAKVAAETACLDAHRKGNIEVSIVRPVFIYGPGDRRGGFLPELVAMMAKGKFKLIGGGKNRIPLVYISDLTDILVRCAVRPESSGQIYNACSKGAPRWRELAKTLCCELNVRKPGSVSVGLVRCVAGLLESLARIKLLKTLPLSKAAVNLLALDVSFPTGKAERELGSESEVGFAEGIACCLPMLKELQQVK
ncbi:MAG: NAD-dependent epimerase/dehydratase family protein [Porticoccaceae bacterium]